MDSDEHTARTQTHSRAQPRARAAPRLRTFVRISTHEPRPVCAPLPAFPRTSRPRVCAPSSAFLRTSRALSAHRRPYSDLPAAPRLRTFAPNPTIRLCPVCAPPSSLLRTFSPTSTYFFTRFYGPVRQIIKRIYTNHLKYSYKSFKRVI